MHRSQYYVYVNNILQYEFHHIVIANNRTEDNGCG